MYFCLSGGGMLHCESADDVVAGVDAGNAGTFGGYSGKFGTNICQIFNKETYMAVVR
jgi:hypothetical protein